ncbi:MAG: ABC transporter substrate-binding protein [Chloroflexi bacterium]|nr:ABC transporter substrate-binding protein [Chloroflexota bacterium]
MLIHKTSTPTINLSLESLWGGDWTKGPAGTNEAGFFAYIGQLTYFGPRLATSYEIPDDKTLIFHIRKGVHYALDTNNEASRLVNGREFTAEDAASSLNAWYFDPEGIWQTRVVPEERPFSIEALDKYTVRINARPGTLSSVIYYASDFSAIFPPEVYQKYNKMRDWKASVGTGPFTIKDYVDGSVATYVRNPNYWDKDPIGPGKGNQLPYLDGVKFLIITDPSTRMSALRTGKVDGLIGEPPAKAGLSWDDAQLMVKTNPALKYVRYLTGAGRGITLRVDKPDLPWYNKRVRQALTMAIDYKTIIRDYFKGNAELVWPLAPYPEFLPMYTPMAQQNDVVRDMFTYQPEKAKKILAEEGYPNGFKIEMLTTAPMVDELSILKEYLAKIDVQVDIQVRESAVFTSTVEGANHKHAVYGGGAGFTSAPWAFHPTNPTDVLNYARINDQYANKVYLDTRQDYMLNESKLWPMMKGFFQYVLEQAWVIPFPGPYVYHVWWPWLKNYHGEDYLGISNRNYWTKYVWIDQDLKKSMGY